ncbi:MAG: hypothetical protein ABSG16_23410 [Candidatus Acidiferrum sp.]
MSNKTKAELIGLLTQLSLQTPGNTASEASTMQYFATKTVPELEQLWTKALDDAEKLAEAKLEAHIQASADLAAQDFQIRIKQEALSRPKIEAQEKADRETFLEGARRYKSYSTCDANWNLVRASLRPGFTVYDLATVASVLNLVPPSDVEQEQYAQEAIKAHNDYLKNASPEELRRIIRQQADERRAAALQTHVQQQDAAREAREANAGFPPIPQVAADGTVLDSAYFIRLSNTNLDLYKQFMRKHGSSNLTARLRGER